MAYFKVKSVTNKLAKRHPDLNRVLDIEVNAKFGKDTHLLGAGREIVINADNLPLSVHRLRAKGLVEVITISEDSYHKQTLAKANAIGSAEPVVEDDVIIPAPFAEADDEDEDDETKRNRKKQRSSK